MKRLLDVAAALAGLVVTGPLLAILACLIWLRDRHSPFYASPRVGQGNRTFRMIKLRSMIPDADRSGVDSTGAEDPRITPMGHVIRRFKLDELPQLVNVLAGDMSLVGPRPQVEREVRLYTPRERRLLEVRPGITDISSIVFSDLADILRREKDADIAYNQLVRPGKSALGLFYVDHRSLGMDARLIGLTLLAMVSRPRALSGVQRLLQRRGASRDLVDLASRRRPLVAMPPPGSDRIVTSRDVPLQPFDSAAEARR